MNQELRGLVQLLGLGEFDDLDSWRRIVLLANEGAVPRPVEGVAWGFKLLLLDRSGNPEWFLRCSWADAHAMARENALLRALMTDPVAREHIPETRIASSPRLTIQASRHLGHAAYSRYVHERSSSLWSSEVTQILEVSRKVVGIAVTRIPDLAAEGTLSARQRALEAAILRLTGIGFPAGLLRRLLEVASAALVLEPRPQHGDLWPANVLRHSGRWWIIDFAECGLVWSPLYDAFHMLMHGPREASRPWFALAGDRPLPDHWSDARAAVLRSAAGLDALGRSDVAAAFVYYLVHLTGYRLRPGVPKSFSESLVADLHRVGMHLDRDSDASTLLPWD